MNEYLLLYSIYLFFHLIEKIKKCLLEENWWGTEYRKQLRLSFLNNSEEKTELGTGIRMLKVYCYKDPHLVQILLLLILLETWAI